MQSKKKRTATGAATPRRARKMRARGKRSLAPVPATPVQGPAEVPVPAADPPRAPSPPPESLGRIESLVPAYKSYVDRCVGLNFGDYPKFMDDLLERSIVTMQVVTGTGSKTISLDAVPTVIHASIVGVDPAKVSGPYQVTATVHLPETLGPAEVADVAPPAYLGTPDTSLYLAVTASDPITWSILLLTQKGKA